MNLNFVSYIYVCIMHAYIEFLLISMFHVLKEDSEGGITTFSFQIRTDGLVCPAVAGAPDIADASEVPDTPEAADNNNLCSEAVDQILDGSLCCADAVTVKSAPDSTFVCTPYETDCCETNTSANRIFIGESEQLVKFINEIINSTCLVPGKLELHSVEEAGMGVLCFVVPVVEAVKSSSTPLQRERMAVPLFQQLYRWLSFVPEHLMHNIEGFYVTPLECGA